VIIIIIVIIIITIIIMITTTRGDDTYVMGGGMTSLPSSALKCRTVGSIDDEMNGSGNLLETRRYSFLYIPVTNYDFCSQCGRKMLYIIKP